MPWLPELFSAPARVRVEQMERRELVAIPFFEGLLTGEMEALIGSFAGDPEVHHPVRGRVRGTRAFEGLMAETRDMLARRNVNVEHTSHLLQDDHGFEEVVLHLDGPSRRVSLPLVLVADRRSDRRIEELRMYFSTWPLAGRHSNRPPVLQPDPELHLRDVVGEYQQALASGDAEAVVACFEPDGYAREPAGGAFMHSGGAALRSFYEMLFSNGGGIPLEHCTAVDDGEKCALEYNVVHWGETELPPQAGVAVYERGLSGRLVAARIYDDADPPIGHAS